MRIRLAIIAATCALVTSLAWGDVRIGVRGDGSKYIYNVGGGSSRRAVDYNWLVKQHNRSTGFDALIDKHSRTHGVDPVLVKAVIQVESNFNVSCVSNKGARGLMQLMPETARRFKVAEIDDPDQNIRGGVAYLSYLLRYFSNDLQKVLAAYNAGENAVLRYGGIPPYNETQTYVSKALTVYYGRPYGSSGGAVSYAGHRSKSTLKGGFKQAPKPFIVASASLVPPLATDSVRFLNAR